jgi:hypothetical protein
LPQALDDERVRDALWNQYETAPDSVDVDSKLEDGGAASGVVDSDPVQDALMKSAGVKAVVRGEETVFG